MRLYVKAALAAVIAAAALPARAQVQSALDRDQGLPAGLSLPLPGAAAAEEPTALAVNPAGVGFVPRLAVQAFHERDVTPGSSADAIFAADGVGPLGVGFGMQWVRPGSGDGPRYRKTTFALALTDTRALSLAIGWNRWASRDDALERLSSWDVGLTVRPTRWLSVAAAMRDRDARLSGEPLPIRYDLGVATRLWRDGLTLSLDLLGDDDRRDALRVTHLATGLGAEVWSGLAVSAQLQLPLRSGLPTGDRPAAVVALSWNGPYVGWTGGAVPVRDRTGSLVGVRFSGERYRAAFTGHDVPAIDVERALEPPRTFLFFTFGEPDPYGRLLARLEAARDDPEVAAVAVRIDDLGVGAGRAEALRAALARIRERKPVLAYLAGGGTIEYWIASAATEIAAQPGSTLFVNGVSTSTLFVKEPLARIGVAFEVVKRGAYKSAPEPLVRTEGSPEAREMVGSLLDDVFGRFVGDVAAARRVPEERVRALADRGLFGAEEAKAEGLLDAVLWPDELEGWARRVTKRRVQVTGGYSPDEERRAQRWGPAAYVEVVRVEGAIAGGKSRGDRLGVAAIAGAETIAAQLRRAADDSDVKAIVLRIDSPGGDGVASDRIWREVQRARRRKPVIASMGDAAASGGYLVAVGADTILAEPSTLTGSIGVFALKPDLSGLLAKLGVVREAAARGENAQLTSLAKPWSAPERAAVEREIERFYALFVARVAEGRKLTAAEVETVAGGRVWTGRQAQERRLVDGLGSLRDAIQLARERARLTPDDVVIVRTAKGGEDGADPFSVGIFGTAPSPLARTLAAIPELRALSLVSEMGPVLALPVEWVDPPPAP
ncbi:signal peptide peptidase SppA [Anaeromyxobacter soli]|uniref:signal peptide peptidase SppA n=1 Tax=Anaeromyxobacter soli TaxID=2922725 RepID=UPI001FAEFEB4|nr:signal peptide peptidase SppA [Anaeromyxobacter sp. SG29]